MLAKISSFINKCFFFTFANELWSLWFHKIVNWSFERAQRGSHWGETTQTIQGFAPSQSRSGVCYLLFLSLHKICQSDNCDDHLFKWLFKFLTSHTLDSWHIYQLHEKSWVVGGWLAAIPIEGVGHLLQILSPSTVVCQIVAWLWRPQVVMAAFQIKFVFLYLNG